MAIGDPPIPEPLLSNMEVALRTAEREINGEWRIAYRDPTRYGIVLLAFPLEGDDAHYMATTKDREKVRAVLRSKLDYLDGNRLIEAARQGDL